MTIQWLDDGPPAPSPRSSGLNSMTEQGQLDLWAEQAAQDAKARWADVDNDLALQLAPDTFEDGTGWTQEELKQAVAHGMRALYIEGMK